jgi:type VI protein secretion system component VasK
MEWIPRLPARVWIVTALALALIVTIVLWVTGDIGTATQLTAYATTVLAIGTVGLAGGAIGTYIEQRKANQSQAVEIAEQERQLERAMESDIAQVLVRRSSGPGEKVRVEVKNNSSRAIRFVYIWVSVEGVPGFYHTVVIETDSRTGQDIRSRRMQNAPPY